MSKSYYIIDFERSDNRTVNRERAKHVTSLPEARAMRNRRFRTEEDAKKSLPHFETLTGLNGEVFEAMDSGFGI